MKIRTVIAGTAAALLSASPAPAQELPTRVSAKTLTGVCAENRAACLTYVLGAVDGMRAVAALTGRRQQPFCLPADVTNEQIAETAIAHMRAHPEEEKTNAAAVIAAGLGRKWPCARP